MGPIPFQKHFKIESITKQKNRFVLAPVSNKEIGSNIPDLRIPYVDVPQKVLKKRWNMSGTVGGEKVFSMNAENGNTTTKSREHKSKKRKSSKKTHRKKPKIVKTED